MPNNVTNVLTVEGVSEERAAEILAAIRMDDVEGRRSIDFNKIIPMPEDVFRGNLGEEERQLYGRNNWYAWSIEHWNTKWNSYDYDGAPYHDDSNQIEFMTAWTAPSPVIERLSRMFPDAQFRHAWADEDIGCNVGEIVYQDGGQLDYDVPAPQSKEAYEMAADVIGFDLRENGYRFSDQDSTYHYHEKPDCPLIGQDGNIFNLVGIASRTLKQNGLREEAGQMSRRVFDSGSYDEALGIICEYVNVTSVDDESMDEDEDFGMGGQT